MPTNLPAFDDAALTLLDAESDRQILARISDTRQNALWFLERSAQQAQAQDDVRASLSAAHAAEKHAEAARLHDYLAHRCEARRVVATVVPSLVNAPKPSWAKTIVGMVLNAIN